MQSERGSGCDFLDFEVSEIITMVVYVGICTERGICVEEENALPFIRSRGFDGDPNVLIPWFFSGNWVKKEIRDSRFGESLTQSQGVDGLLAAGFLDE